jgi:pilus assembly protein CpaE
VSDTFKVILADPDESSRDELKSILMGMDSVWFEADCSRYEFFSEVVKSSVPDVAVVTLDSDPALALEVIAEARAAAPNCNFIVVSESTDSQLILKSIRAGAKEYLNLPLSARDLSEAFSRLTLHNGKQGGKKNGRIIAVSGSGGGVGSTSVAVNIASYLATDKKNKVVLVDLDLALGDADIYLDTIPEYTLSDLVQNVSRLDESLVEKTLSQHETGVFLLARPIQLQEIEDVTPDAIGHVIQAMKPMFTHIILDLSKSFNSIDVVALREADDILLLAQLDLPCLRNVVRLMMSFEEVDGLKQKTKVVVNRAGMGNNQISMAKAKETIGGDIFWQLPNEYRIMVDVRNNGVPLIQHSPKAVITQSIIALADKLEGKSEADGKSETTAKKSKWLGFLPSKS